jgi:integrase
VARDVADKMARYEYAEPIDCSNVYKRYLQPALKALKLNPSRWHDLRHAFAIMSLSNGEHYMQVSKWLGHSTFTLSLDIYGDYISSAEGGKAAPLALRPVVKAAESKVVPPDAFGPVQPDEAAQRPSDTSDLGDLLVTISCE